MYLIWILESRLIRSNNQSSATLWVLETCLIVGLLPLLIILITASLSSKMYNWTHLEKSVRLWWRSPDATVAPHLGFPFVWCWICDFANSFLLWDWLVVWYCSTVTLLAPHSIHQEQIIHPSIRCPASNEMISYSEELWDTDVCFLHIQLITTNVRLRKIHKIPPEVDFESSWSPAKSESWNRPNRLCRAVLPTLSVVTCVMNVWKQTI